MSATPTGSISFPFEVLADQASGAGSVTFNGASASRTFDFTDSGAATTTTSGSGSGTTSGNAGSSLGDVIVLSAGSSLGNRSVP